MWDFVEIRNSSSQYTQLRLESDTRISSPLLKPRHCANLNIMEINFSKFRKERRWEGWDTALLSVILHRKNLKWRSWVVGDKRKQEMQKPYGQKRKAQVTNTKGRPLVHSPSRRTSVNLKGTDLLRFLFVKYGSGTRIGKFRLGFSCLVCLASW